MSDQRLQYVVADHLGQAHLLREYVDDTAQSPIQLLKSIFSKDPELRMTYGHTHLVLLNSASLLEPMNQTKDWDNLSQFLLPNIEGAIHLNDCIDEFGIKVVYPFSESANSLANQMFTNLRVSHCHTLLIQMFGNLCATSDARLFTYIQGGVMSVLLFNKSKLQYCNQFEAHSEDDIVYYLMLVYDQFDLDPLSQSLHASIGQEGASAVILKLRSYIKHIEILEFQPETERSKPVFEDSSIYKQYYFPLSATNLFGKLKPC